MRPIDHPGTGVAAQNACALNLVSALPLRGDLQSMTADSSDEEAENRRNQFFRLKDDKTTGIRID